MFTVSDLYDRYVAWCPDHQRGPVKSLSDLQAWLQGFLSQESDLGHLDSYTGDSRLLCFTIDEVHFLISSEAMTTLV